MKINDNAYKIAIPATWGISNTFNVAGLDPFHQNEPYYVNKRRLRIQRGERMEWTVVLLEMGVHLVTVVWLSIIFGKQ